MKKKILLILIFINIFSYFSASTIDLSSFERQLKNCNHCSGIEGELKTRLEKFILEEDFYEFNYNEKNEKYKFFIPKGTIVKENKNTYIKNETFYLDFAGEQNLSFPIELIKKVSKLREEFERENGKIKKISGDVNPADLGFHR